MVKSKWLIIKGGILCGAVVIALSVHGSFLIAMLENWSEVQVRKNQVKEAQSWHEITRRLEADNKVIKAQLTAIEERVPRDELLSNIIHFIQKTGQKTGVKFDFIKPGRPLKVANYHRLTFEMGIRGTYHTLGKFLSAMESSENVIQVEAFDLSTKDMVSKRLTITIRIAVFFARAL